MERGSPPAAPLQSLFATALVFLLLAQAQRAFFSCLYGIWAATATPGVAALLILLPLLPLLAPLLPLALLLLTGLYLFALPYVSRRPRTRRT